MLQLYQVKRDKKINIVNNNNKITSLCRLVMQMHGARKIAILIIKSEHGFKATQKFQGF